MAKQEKYDKIQKMKQKVAEMVKSRAAGKKHKHSFNVVLENKICKLYDLYVERLEEESGPPVEKLYEEEKLKTLPSNGNLDHTDTKPSSLLPKKKAKWMPYAEAAEANLLLKKLVALPLSTVDVKEQPHLGRRRLRCPASGTPVLHLPTYNVSRHPPSRL
ncbi:hypothetical protein SASPL_131303 [Salvia splendens]|uniref:Uncharacterized protein n=1 Tax=Salvia splendens TaxID=180675 RepID=A0A8X8ZKV8_SALSN|nr:hypothetical protein SASPL_131303 [Salvia splendens]